MTSISVRNNGSIAQDRFAAFTVPYAVQADLNSTLPSKLGVTIGSTEYEAFRIRQQNSSAGGAGTPNDSDIGLFLCRAPWPTGDNSFTIDAPGNNDPDTFVMPIFATVSGETCGPPSLQANIGGGLSPDITPIFKLQRNGVQREVGVQDPTNWVEIERTATAITYLYKIHSQAEGMTIEFTLELATGSNLARFWVVWNFFNPWIADGRETFVDKVIVELGQEMFMPYRNVVDMDLTVDGGTNASFFQWNVDDSTWQSEWRDGRNMPCGYGYIFGRGPTTITADENLYTDIKTNGDLDGHGHGRLNRGTGGVDGWQDLWGPWQYLNTTDTTSQSVTNVNLATVSSDGVGRDYDVGSEAAPSTSRITNNTGFQGAYGHNFGGEIIDGLTTLDTLLAGNGHFQVLQGHFRERGGDRVTFAAHPGMATQDKCMPVRFGACNDILGKVERGGNRDGLVYDERRNSGRVLRNYSIQHTVLNPVWTEYALTMNPIAYDSLADFAEMCVADDRIFRPSKICGTQDVTHREFGRKALSMCGVGWAAKEFDSYAREWAERAYAALRNRYIGNSAIRNGNPLRNTRNGHINNFNGTGTARFFWNVNFDAFCPVGILACWERGYLDDEARDFALEILDAHFQYGTVLMDPLGGSNRFWFLGYQMSHTLDGTNPVSSPYNGSTSNNALNNDPNYGTAYSVAARTDTNPNFADICNPGDFTGLNTWGIGAAVAVREFAENGKDPNGKLSTDAKNRAYAAADSMLAYYHTGTPAKFAQISFARWGSIYSPY